jgi:hypothetical protein
LASQEGLYCTELEMEAQLIGRCDAGRLYPNTVFGRCETCLFQQPFALQLTVQILIHGISSASSCQAVRTISPATSIKCQPFLGANKRRRIRAKWTNDCVGRISEVLVHVLRSSKVDFVVHEMGTYRFSIFGGNVLGPSHMVVPPSVTGLAASLKMIPQIAPGNVVVDTARWLLWRHIGRLQLPPVKCASCSVVVTVIPDG